MDDLDKRKLLNMLSEAWKPGVVHVNSEIADKFGDRIVAAAARDPLDDIEGGLDVSAAIAAFPDPEIEASMAEFTRTIVSRYMNRAL